MIKSRKLSVGLVFDDSLDSNDGVAQHVKTLGSWMSRQGHDVKYFVGETKINAWRGDTVYSLSKNIKVRFNANSLSIPLPADSTRIRSLLKKEKLDVIHVMMPYSPFLAQKIINNASNSIVIIGTFHILPSGWLSISGSRLLRLMTLRSLKRFSSIMSVSPAAADFAKKTFGIDSRVVPNPVDISVFSNKVPKQSGNNIVFLGRLVKRKGCQQLLKAFACLVPEIPDANLIIAGDGPLKKNLISQAKKLGISDRVQFIGYIKEEDKPALLASADIACFPSLYGESFGIVLIEAMAAGAKTVLGGDNPGYRSVLGTQQDLLVDPNDTQQFTLKMLKLLQDKKLASSIANWQKDEVKKYDISVVGEQVIDTYLSSIARLDKINDNGIHE
jgi:phosphatidylinositol alpha-mannosyltransferase